jgi:hypothetical protein
MRNNLQIYQKREFHRKGVVSTEQIYDSYIPPISHNVLMSLFCRLVLELPYFLRLQWWKVQNIASIFLKNFEGQIEHQERRPYAF